MTFDLRESLSDRAQSVWAKSHQDPNQAMALQGWLPLYQHLDDAAGIAAHLWDDWAPRSVKTLLANTFGGEESARTLLIWLAGTHDVGKASPAFAMQVQELADHMELAGLTIDPRLKDTDDRRFARHELVSFLSIREWLQQQHDFDEEQAGYIASIAAAHHGRPASIQGVRAAIDRPHAVGTDAWHDTRQEILDAAATTFIGENDVINRWRNATISQPALVLLSSLVIVSDWIASGDLFAPAQPGSQPHQPTTERVAAAWADLQFPHPWLAQPESIDPATLLAERFTLPSGSTPHPTQTALVELALRAQRPELMILEAEMGSGKTEAALLAAEILAGTFGLSGIFIGLPTQATADGMFMRVLSWIEALGLTTPSNVFLARGRAELNTAYAKKTREAYYRSIGQDEPRKADADGALVIAHRWFSNPRRGPLANFVVGTVDQALFAGLRSRYVMLRHLALASKVVIIDEVHAYDEYMGQFLTRVLEWLGAYGVPVILLSATLPSARRKEYLSAYDRGRESLLPRIPAPKRSWAEKRAQTEAAIASRNERYDDIAGELAYPSIVTSNLAGKPVTVFPRQSGSTRTAHLERIDDELETLVRTLRTALRAGGNVAVIRNTVRRAQETADRLREEFTDVTLAHSRFLGSDRARKDRELLRRYGRDGDRPEQSIVVATQVIEQSLDVDFDLIISDIAPIDLLLQRTGRMHRHTRADRPTPLREPRLVLTGAGWEESPPEFEKGSEKIYGRAVLLRTAAALRDRMTISTPDMIAPLIELVYGEGSDYVPDQWLDSLAEAERKRDAAVATRIQQASTFTLGAVNTEDPTLIGWVNGPNVDPELTPPGQGTVRDGDETLEVIMLQRGDDDILRTPGWLEKDGGVQIPEGEAPSYSLTQTILGCFLRLPAGMCHGSALDRHIESLEHSFDLPYWHTSHALKGELVLVCDAHGSAKLNEFDLRYSPDNGLEYERRTA